MANRLAAAARHLRGFLESGQCRLIAACGATREVAGAQLWLIHRVCEGPVHRSTVCWRSIGIDTVGQQWMRKLDAAAIKAHDFVCLCRFEELGDAARRGVHGSRDDVHRRGGQTGHGQQNVPCLGSSPLIRASTSSDSVSGSDISRSDVAV
ncbi:MAG TPA: hypothetical protein VE666_08085 [Mycobacterium sp.]|nr:hypothetical protein [Mycobacterium sp.]